ncbi:MAG: hypothetical protein HC884_12080 [Chloroflexaceae bacterium]|nr:hypothetical protein [Chloroflexaceae bacterium]
MKGLLRFLGLIVLIAVVVLLFRTFRRRQHHGASYQPPVGSGSAPRPASGQKRTISPELLEILADPADKGPVELMVTDGKEWLVNRRNGYRYPVEDGIPIMLIEEGEKNKDERLIATGTE